MGVIFFWRRGRRGDLRRHKKDGGEERWGVECFYLTQSESVRPKEKVQTATSGLTLANLGWRSAGEEGYLFFSVRPLLFKGIH